jgi:hypothetical protein
MPQTLYIDSDEEIVSLLARLRRTADRDMVLVFPKHAMVLQSLVNIRLLGREAAKQEKNLELIVADEQQLLLAQRAGLQATLQRGGMPDGAPHMARVAPAAEQYNMPEATPEAPMRELGSNSFAAPKSPKIAAKAPRRAAPKNNFLARGQKSSSNLASSGMSSDRSSRYSGQLAIIQSLFGDKQPRDGDEIAVEPMRPFRTEPKSNSGGNAAWWLIGCVVVAMLGGLGYMGYQRLYPTAYVTLSPQISEDTRTFSVRGAQSPQADQVSVRVIARDYLYPVIDVKTAAAGKKATGKIVITNNYSKEPQSLVATTRFETADKKIYRLVKGVTVPGMSGTSPGTIEADVIADKGGDNYNISNGTFTIPGFAGNAKFAKFSATLKGSMTGGSGDGSGSIVPMEDAKVKYLADIANQISATEKLIDNTLSVAAEGEPTESGGSKQQRYVAKAFIVNTESLNSYTIQNTVGTKTPYDVVQTTYKFPTALPRFEDGTVDFTFEVAYVFNSRIDIAGIKTALLGVKNENMQDFLAKHPEVKKVAVRFEPRSFTQAIPADESKVRVNIAGK